MEIRHGGSRVGVFWAVHAEQVLCLSASCSASSPEAEKGSSSLKRSLARSARSTGLNDRSEVCAPCRICLVQRGSRFVLHLSHERFV